MNSEFINKNIVDKNGKTVYFLRYFGYQLKKKNINILIDTIYKNFEEIAEQKSLNHNRKEIARLLTSSQSIIIIGILNDNIISYLIAESAIYNQRKFMHIAYLYTSSNHRGNGIAIYALNLIQKYALELNITTLSLTYDTHNKSLSKFYFNNYFEYDQDLRSFQRYDMLVKYIIE